MNKSKRNGDPPLGYNSDGTTHEHWRDQVVCSLGLDLGNHQVRRRQSFCEIFLDEDVLQDQLCSCGTTLSGGGAPTAIFALVFVYRESHKNAYLELIFFAIYYLIYV